MNKITVGVLTISDRCAIGAATDDSGSNLVRLVDEGILKNAVVLEQGLVPDSETLIKCKLMDWSDEKKLGLILTTGGTGVGPRDVTPEATASVLDKTIPGISQMMFIRSCEVTPFASLSRALAGVRGKTLIINLPGSKKGSQECLESVAAVIPHAVDLIQDAKMNVENVHAGLNVGRISKVGVVSEKARTRKSPYPVLRVTEAQDIILDKVDAFRRVKTMAYHEALGHVLAEEVNAMDNLPPFDASIKDGYAVISRDRSSPKVLMGACAAGALPDRKVVAGSCLSVNTGAPIPEGADTVVPVEDTSFVQDGSVTRIKMTAFPPPGENIRPKGFDFAAGALLMPMGTYLGSSAIGLLAAAGVLSVRVFEKPEVAVMSTGDEIVDPAEGLGAGKVRDSNRITLISMLREEGYNAHDLGIVKDEPDALLTSLMRGFEKSDVVVTTGSMSMGDRDYLKDVLRTDFGGEILFGAVFMKPGKPTAFATLSHGGKSKVWFGLPGNPASAVVTTHLFLLPALRHMSGNRNAFPSRVEATLSFDIKLLDRPHYHRGILSYSAGKFTVSTTGEQSSSRVGSCTDANCLIEIGDGTGTVTKGTNVTALVIGKNF